MIANRLFTSGLFIGILAVAMPAARASVIFTNFGPSFAYDITEGNPVGNDFAGDNSGEGGTFVPTTSGNFGSAELALSCVSFCSAGENFTVALTADSSDSPGAAIETFSFTGVSLGGLGSNNAPLVITSILNPLLSAGTRYWLTVTSTTDFAIAWNFNSTSDPSDQALSSDGGATWFSPSGQTPGAFEIDSLRGAVTPEPGTFLLIGGGLLMAAAFGRRLGSRV